VHRTLNGAVAGGLKHGEQGPALAVAQAQASLAPGQRSLEHHTGLGAGRVAAVHCECPLGRAGVVEGRASMIPRRATQAPLLSPSCPALRRTHAVAHRI
jgi:hypothetical protein